MTLTATATLTGSPLTLTWDLDAPFKDPSTNYVNVNGSVDVAVAVNDVDHVDVNDHLKVNGGIDGRDDLARGPCDAP